MSADYLQGFYLGDLLIEPLKGQVNNKGDTRHLPPKAVEVLLCLAATPGELVTREALLHEVWGDGYGSKEALSHAVSEIRHALDDHADEPVFVQTVRGRGYRLAVVPQALSAHSDSIVIGAQNGANGLSFFENVKQRGVIETALAYLILGWLIIQVADIVFAQLLLPAWGGTFVTAFVIAGFPLALILSWFLEFRDGRAVVDQLSPRDAQRRRFSRTYLSIVGALVVASILVYGYDYQVGLPSAEKPVQTTAPKPGRVEVPVTENSIAVLPFFNVDGSNESQAFANGLADDVIHRLARVPGLRVSSRGDSFTLNPNSASELVRRRLRVAMYLEGSVQVASDSIRVVVQLINSADGFHIQSRTFDRPREGYFDIRDEITQLTVSSLRVALPDDTQAMSQATNHDPGFDAYVLYRRGMDDLHKPGTTETLESAIDWMDQALAVDPEYAAAYAGKCRAYISLFRESDDPAYVDHAEHDCATALNLNPNLDVVHHALGRLYHSQGHYEEAESAFLEALRINPRSVQSMLSLADVYRLQQRSTEAEGLLVNARGLQPGNSQAYSALGYFYFRQGRYREAAEQWEVVVSLDERNMRGLANLGTAYMLAGDFAAAAPVFARSIDIEPSANTYSSLGLMNYYLGHYDAAVQAIKNGIELAPNEHLMWMNLGDIYTNADREDDARDAFLRARDLVEVAVGVNPNDPSLMMDVAWIEAMLGNDEAARSNIQRAAQSQPDDPYIDYVNGLIHNRSGDTGEAIAALRSAVDKGYSQVILAAEPHLKNLHNDKRFSDLISE